MSNHQTDLSDLQMGELHPKPEPTDRELRDKAELAEVWATNAQITLRNENYLAVLSFISGYDAAIAYMLKVLRSKEAMGWELDSGCRPGDFAIAADRIEKKLKDNDP